MKRISRILTSALLAGSLIAACSPAGGEGSPSSDASQVDTGYLEIVSFSEENGSVIIGNPDAKVELIEYASLTCGHCKDFHIDVLSSIKKDYIATGKVRFVFQEFPTPPVEIALAGFAVARCSGESGYLGALDDFFANQDAIFEAGRAGTIGEALIAYGERNGVKEADFEDCVINQNYRRAVSASVSHGQGQGINSTPSLLLNGEKLESGESRTPGGLASLIDSALEAAGETSAAPEN